MATALKVPAHHAKTQSSKSGNHQLARQPVASLYSSSHLILLDNGGRQLQSAAHGSPALVGVWEPATGASAAPGRTCCWSIDALNHQWNVCSVERCRRWSAQQAGSTGKGGRWQAGNQPVHVVVNVFPWWAPGLQAIDILEYPRVDVARVRRAAGAPQLLPSAALAGSHHDAALAPGPIRAHSGVRSHSCAFAPYQHKHGSSWGSTATDSESCMPAADAAAAVMAQPSQQSPSSVCSRQSGCPSLSLSSPPSVTTNWRADDAGRQSLAAHVAERLARLHWAAALLSALQSQSAQLAPTRAALTPQVATCLSQAGRPLPAAKVAAPESLRWAGRQLAGSTHGWQQRTGVLYWSCGSCCKWAAALSPGPWACQPAQLRARGTLSSTLPRSAIIPAV